MGYSFYNILSAKIALIGSMLVMDQLNITMCYLLPIIIMGIICITYYCYLLITKLAQIITSVTLSL